MQEAFGLGPDDRVLQKTPFTLRRLGLGVLLAAVGRRAAGRGDAGGHQDAPLPGAADPATRGSRPCTSCRRCSRSSWRSRRLGRAALAAPRRLQRRGAALRSWCGGSSSGCRQARAAQPLRPDRGGGGRRPGGRAAARRRRARRADRPADRQHARLRRRPRPAAGAGRRAGRAAASAGSGWPAATSTART